MQTTYYFGYGSNIWREQMRKRCPESKFIGVAVLRNWRWFINKRGVANIAPSAKENHDVVYGSVYILNVHDEAALDGFEGVPDIYQKIDGLPVELTRSEIKAINGSGSDIINTLVYVDHNDVTDGKIREEYIARIRRAIADGIQDGIPAEYFEKYFEPFLPS